MSINDILIYYTKDSFYLAKENFGAAGVKFSKNYNRQILFNRRKPALCGVNGTKKETMQSL